MKNVLFVVVEFLLFLVVFFLGSVILPGAGVLPVMSTAAGAGKIFVYDGVLLLLALYVFFLLVAVLRKRIFIAWQNPTIAAVLALVLGLLMKFGFKSVS